MFSSIVLFFLNLSMQFGLLALFKMGEMVWLNL